MINKNMLISEIVEKYPEVVEVLMEDYGVHCFGCGGSMFETLEEGLGGHGLNEIEINEAIDKLNKHSNSELEHNSKENLL